MGRHCEHCKSSWFVTFFRRWLGDLRDVIILAHQECEMGVSDAILCCSDMSGAVLALPCDVVALLYNRYAVLAAHRAMWRPVVCSDAAQPCSGSDAV